MGDHITPQSKFFQILCVMSIFVTCSRQYKFAIQASAPLILVGLLKEQILSIKHNFETLHST